MELLEAILLGILQGVFEWLPVSSEAVVSVFMTQLLGTTVIESVNTAIWLHLGTMFAALLYFRSDFTELTRRSIEKLKNKDGTIDTVKDKEIAFIILTTFTTGVFGGTLYLIGIKSLTNSPDLFAAITGLALVFTGLARLYSKKASRESINLEPKDSVYTGILQGMAVVPGISRSGSTVFGLLYHSFSAKEAFRLSFLISVPAVFLANIGINIFSGFTLSLELLVAAATAFGIGYLTIDLVLKIADRAEIAYLCFGLALISFLPLFI